MHNMKNQKLNSEHQKKQVGGSNFGLAKSNILQSKPFAILGMECHILPHHNYSVS
jgi:hypothetical protein